MFRLSAFADEISPDPQEQVDVLDRCGVRCIELRSILKTNVLDLTDLQVSEFKSLLDRRGFRLSAIGSPIGKTKIDQPFEATRKRLERAIELCKVFGTSTIRIFSYYLADGTTWPPWRDEVHRRMRAKAEIADKAGVRLVHENEHAIYGDDPDRVVDLMQNVDHPALRAVYDPANYVFCGFDPWQGWQKTKQYTVHFHIKDWVAGEKHGRLSGEGQGRIPEVIAEAVAAGYDGFATLEPHLIGGGPTGGVTGPELFPKAVEAFKKVLERAGASYA
ncbi:MAG: sugar phosphate isomerase/epimerase [Planctomycetes bacterium]|nr:sugar phosphate isomerase/epimerase [Planctomycetota bacterium]